MKNFQVSGFSEQQLKAGIAKLVQSNYGKASLIDVLKKIIFHK